MIHQLIISRSRTLCALIPYVQAYISTQNIQEKKRNKLNTKINYNIQDKFEQSECHEIRKGIYK